MLSSEILNLSSEEIQSMLDDIPGTIADLVDQMVSHQVFYTPQEYFSVNDILENVMEQKLDDWISGNTQAVSAFELGIGFGFKAIIDERTFDYCCVQSVSVMQRFAALIKAELTILTHADAKILSCGAFEVILSKAGNQISKLIDLSHEKSGQKWVI